MIVTSFDKQKVSTSVILNRLEEEAELKLKFLEQMRIIFNDYSYSDFLESIDSYSTFLKEKSVYQNTLKSKG